MSDQNSKKKRGMLSLTMKDKALLYAAYMPFLEGGGLFVPTEQQYEMGEEVFLLLTLMDEADKIPVVGQVAWITPIGAQNNRSAGIGIQFTDPTGEVKRKIELHLAGMIESNRPTHTL